MIRRPAASAMLAAMLAGAAPGWAGAAAHPNALWRVVHDLCVPLHRLTRVATPCLEVDGRRHVAVVPNPRSPTEVLLVPTTRITGIEDPALQAPDAPNYWRDAWAARSFVIRRAGRGEIAPDDLALAVNAVPGRSQQQLHIHVDCVRADVKAALDEAAPGLSARWTRLRLRGGSWRIRRLEGDAPAPDPFRLLAQDLPGAADDMGAWTLVVVGLAPGEGAPGFALLARRVEPGFTGHGEFLLDKRCAVLAQP